MKFVPRSYQSLCVNHVLENRRAGLFLDMGLGKTAISLNIIDYVLYADLQTTKPFLVVAPLRVADVVWEEEINQWDNFNHLRISKVLGAKAKREAALKVEADVYVINRENLAWLVAYFGGSLSAIFSGVIIDESSSFRNPKSKRFKAAKLGFAGLDWIVLLTGTPVPNGLLGLWSQIFLLDRGERLGATITSYRSTYFRPGLVLPNGIVAKYNLQQGCDKNILDKIRDICISLKTEECVELPPLSYNKIKVRYSEDTMQMYNEFERESFLEMADVEIVALAAAGLRTKLLQFSNGAVYYDTNHNWTEIHDEKLQALEELLDDLDGRNVLVAYYYKHDLERLQTFLAKRKPRVLRNSQDVKDWNAGKIEVLLAHPASAGHGLNLQHGGSDTIWFGLTDDLELFEQFNKRLHRVGIKRAAMVHLLIAEGTEEEQVVRGLERKSTTQQSLIAGVNALKKKYAKELASAR